MSKTNQVCITCAQRDTCQYYNPNRTICVPVMTEQEMQFELMKSQEKVNALRQEVAAMNKECEYWQHYRIQAAIAVMQGITPEWGNNAKQYAEWAVQVADALVAELQKKQD